MKCNKSQIFSQAHAWKREGKFNTFSSALIASWAKAKKEMEEAKKVVKFVNGMEIEADGYTRTLTRWTKGGQDRVYINGGSRMGDGFVDLKKREHFGGSKCRYVKMMTEQILAMEFEDVFKKQREQADTIIEKVETVLNNWLESKKDDPRFPESKMACEKILENIRKETAENVIKDFKNIETKAHVLGCIRVAKADGRDYRK